MGQAVDETHRGPARLVDSDYLPVQGDITRKV
jgi:hypothetical protein